MMLTIDELVEIINGKEKRNLEFKLAENSFNKDKLMEYCAGMSNEGGGLLILGIQDKPRKIIGTKAFQDINYIEKEILNQLHFKVRIQEMFPENRRVLIFDIPPHPEGLLWQYQGRILSRVGESLVPMSFDQIQKEAQKIIPDYSAIIIRNTNIESLDENYIKDYYSKVDERRSITNNYPIPKRLKDDGLINDKGVTIAAMAMFGLEKSIEKHLPQVETTFIYKSDSKSIVADKRIDFKNGFWGTLHQLMYWITQVYNPKIEIQSNLFIKTIETYDERVVREALLNAFCHRDYRLGYSIRINLFPKHLEVISPGGLPKGVTINNIVDNHKPTNRLLAETLHKCGYVEREGVGYDIMWDRLTKDSKQGPDLSKTTDEEVFLVINGEVNLKFLAYLKKIDYESLSIHQVMILNMISNEKKIDDNSYKKDIDLLLSRNLIEKIKYKRDSKYSLSKQYYESIGKKGEYSRKKGLPDNKYKELILQHIDNFGSAKISELEQLMPEVKRSKILSLLNSLKDNGKIKFDGPKKTGMWIKCG